MKSSPVVLGPTLRGSVNCPALTLWLGGELRRDTAHAFRFLYKSQTSLRFYAHGQLRQPSVATVFRPLHDPLPPTNSVAVTYRPPPALIVSHNDNADQLTLENDELENETREDEEEEEEEYEEEEEKATRQASGEAKTFKLTREEKERLEKELQKQAQELAQELRLPMLSVEQANRMHRILVRRHQGKQRLDAGAKALPTARGGQASSGSTTSMLRRVLFSSGNIEKDEVRTMKDESQESTRNEANANQEEGVRGEEQHELEEERLRTTSDGKEDVALYEFLLEVTHKGLRVVHQPGFPQESNKGPVYCDFVKSEAVHRAKYGNCKDSPFHLAIVPKALRPTQVKVLDATGGLAQDALIAAFLGCQVTVVERNPIVHALIRDGLQRALAHFTALEQSQALTSKDKAMLDALHRMRLVHADSKSLMPSLPEDQIPDVVYIDCMYPAPKKKRKSLAKAGMTVARQLVGDDVDAAELFEAAMKVAKHRVVIKRPKWVEENALATTVYRSPRTRYEVYVPRKQQQE
ncbi:Ribosomal RNA small subunit methyltransferase J [Balamuthia mandrillaris]